ncbi:MarR family winged helix-turn-helix transcriptional regulator [Schleiferilactobacillus harbinensis]|jgi:DNA-binding MarR family transcriptional regulator|uniref:MarR family winged helix-turn-helix transcriptional regulator n=1 Tax=Schleiferilactobacillus harbinensis TaxID=304207 RepID=UPI00242BBA3E|nr:MarR family transcriptional regulator [Schleiferilactobacillus harbinensis]MCI1783618.1 MarR family transcriptional regulator [Schleiferilactobacillus harbinensis]MCI1849316.1 MarR family transcriptional regulator [Schleiferilactobacillus harbinensis]
MPATTPIMPDAIYTSLTHTHRILDTFLQRRLTPLQLTLDNYLIVLFIGQQTELSQDWLMQRLGITASVVTRRLKQLQEQKLITKVANPDDRRGWLVQLSAAGQLTYQKLVEVLLAGHQHLRQGLTDAQLVTFYAMLRQIEINAARPEEMK